MADNQAIQLPFPRSKPVNQLREQSCSTNIRPHHVLVQSTLNHRPKTPQSIPGPNGELRTVLMNCPKEQDPTLPSPTVFSQRTNPSAQQISERNQCTDEEAIANTAISLSPLATVEEPLNTTFLGQPEKRFSRIRDSGFFSLKSIRSNISSRINRSSVTSTEETTPPSQPTPSFHPSKEHSRQVSESSSNLGGIRHDSLRKSGSRRLRHSNDLALRPMAEEQRTVAQQSRAASDEGLLAEKLDQKAFNAPLARPIDHKHSHLLVDQGVLPIPEVESRNNEATEHPPRLAGQRHETDNTRASSAQTIRSKLALLEQSNAPTISVEIPDCRISLYSYDDPCSPDLSPDILNGADGQHSPGIEYSETAAVAPGRDGIGTDRGSNCASTSDIQVPGKRNIFRTLKRRFRVGIRHLVAFRLNALPVTNGQHERIDFSAAGSGANGDHIPGGTSQNQGGEWQRSANRGNNNSGNGGDGDKNNNPAGNGHKSKKRRLLDVASGDYLVCPVVAGRPDDPRYNLKNNKLCYLSGWPQVDMDHLRRVHSDEINSITILKAKDSTREDVWNLWFGQLHPQWPGRYPSPYVKDRHSGSHLEKIERLETTTVTLSNELWLVKLQLDQQRKEMASLRNLLATGSSPSPGGTTSSLPLGVPPHQPRNQVMPASVNRSFNEQQPVQLPISQTGPQQCYNDSRLDRIQNIGQRMPYALTSDAVPTHLQTFHLEAVHFPLNSSADSQMQTQNYDQIAPQVSRTPLWQQPLERSGYPSSGVSLPSLPSTGYSQQDENLIHNQYRVPQHSQLDPATLSQNHKLSWDTVEDNSSEIGFDNYSQLEDGGLGDLSTCLL